MIESFACSICGEEHQGLLSDWAYKLPDEVWSIREAGGSEVARFNDDLCQFEGRNFIRCVLNVPLDGGNGHFGWGVWAEVDWPTFQRYIDLYDEDSTFEPARAGKLANALRPYPRTLGASVTIQFGNPMQRPALTLAASDEGLLAREQRRGISRKRHHEIVNILQDR